MQEIWKKIDDFDYEVSTYGRIRSLDRRVKTWNGERVHRGRILTKIATKPNGYYGVALYKNNASFSVNLHRLIALTFIPNNNPELTQVNHKNGIKTDNRVENLEWVTPQANVRHSHDLGLTNVSKGESHYRSTLDDAKVLAIRNAYKSGSFTQLQIAKQFGIGRQHVSRIVNNKSWSHV